MSTSPKSIAKPRPVLRGRSLERGGSSLMSSQGTPQQDESLTPYLLKRQRLNRKIINQG